MGQERSEQMLDKMEYLLKRQGLLQKAKYVCTTASRRLRKKRRNSMSASSLLISCPVQQKFVSFISWY
jgi:hypothetical protein